MEVPPKRGQHYGGRLKPCQSELLWLLFCETNLWGSKFAEIAIASTGWLSEHSSSQSLPILFQCLFPAPSPPLPAYDPRLRQCEPASQSNATTPTAKRTRRRETATARISGTRRGPRTDRTRDSRGSPAD